MRLALSGASVPEVPLETELGEARGAGFDGVELWLPKAWPVLERLGPHALAGLLGRHRLEVVALAPVPDVTFRDRAGQEAVVAQAQGAAALAREVRASWVVAQPGEQPDGADERDALREAQDILGRLARATERYDVGLAVMPLGFAWASLRTVGQLRQVLERAGRRSLGLAVDTFHFHAGGSSMDDLRRYPARAIGLVRLADAPAGERETLRDHHRLPPGDGVAPIAQILAVVRALGADPALAVHVPLRAGAGDAPGWIRRLAERARAAERASEPALRA